MHPEEQNDPVWNLLKRSPKREASGAFVQNTLRRIRQLEGGQESAFQASFAQFLGRPAVLAPVAALIVAIAAAAVLLRPANQGETIVKVEDSAPAEVIVPIVEDSDLLADELEAMLLVDELVAVNDPYELDDAAIAELLF